MRYIYFEIDNLAPFIEWLQQQPAEKHVVVIGGDGPTQSKEIIQVITRADPALAEWLRQKRITEEIILTLISRRMKVPQGLVI